MFWGRACGGAGAAGLEICTGFVVGFDLHLRGWLHVPVQFGQPKKICPRAQVDKRFLVSRGQVRQSPYKLIGHVIRRHGRASRRLGGDIVREYVHTTKSREVCAADHFLSDLSSCSSYRSVLFQTAPSAFATRTAWIYANMMRLPPMTEADLPTRFTLLEFRRAFVILLIRTSCRVRPEHLVMPSLGNAARL